MLPLERVPAVRRIETDRDDAFAFEITGEFNAGDAENLCGLLEGAYALHERIVLLVRLRDVGIVDLSGLSPETAGLMRSEAALRVARCAVVGGGSRASRITQLFEPAEGIETRNFADGDEDAAWQWLGAREAGLQT